VLAAFLARTYTSKTMRGFWAGAVLVLMALTPSAFGSGEYTTAQFAAEVKTKFVMPEGCTDAEIAAGTLERYPEYATWLDVGSRIAILRVGKLSWRTVHHPSRAKSRKSAWTTTCARPMCRSL
jgi:hypothetical protein